MPIRIALVVCVVFGSFAAGTAAHAGDSYGGFGPSAGTETQEIGSSPDNGVAPLDRGETLPWLQPQDEGQQDTYGSGSAQQGADDNGYDMDDEGGH